LSSTPTTRAPAVWLGALLLAAAVLIGVAGPVRAQSVGGNSSVDTLRQQADATSGAYFAALSRSRVLERQIADLEVTLPQLRDQEAALRRTALGRAVIAYEGRANSQLGAILSSDDVLSAARKAQWLKQLNALDNRSVTDLQTTSDRLRSQEATLRAYEQSQTAAAQQLQVQEVDIQAKLKAAQQAEQQQAAAAAAAAQSRATTSGASASGGAPGSSSGEAGFLACVEHFESGGNPNAFNPGGPAYGLYQFLQTTWDETVSHAGRGDLVGKQPLASAGVSSGTQDAMARVLYEWQGPSPWAGDPC
jgi:Transglycosylase-like domain